MAVFCYQGQRAVGIEPPPWCRAISVQYQQTIGRLPRNGYFTSGPGLAQGARRKQPAVAASAVVKNTHFQIARQSVMLQAVVADDHFRIGMGCQQSHSRLPALAADKHRRTGGALNQEGLIAHGLGGGVGGHLMAVLRLTSKSARDHTHAPALSLQMLHQRDHRGRFASAAGHHIAHHDHIGRNALAVEQVPSKQLTPQCSQCAIQCRHRQQRDGEKPLASPGAHQRTGERLAHGPIRCLAREFAARK